MTVIDDVLFLKFLNDDSILINISEKICPLNGVGLNETSYASEFVHLKLHFYGWLATTIISKTQLPDFIEAFIKSSLPSGKVNGSCLILCTVVGLVMHPCKEPASLGWFGD